MRNQIFIGLSFTIILSVPFADKHDGRYAVAVIVAGHAVSISAGCSTATASLSLDWIILRKQRIPCYYSAGFAAFSRQCYSIIMRCVRSVGDKLPYNENPIKSAAWIIKHTTVHRTYVRIPGIFFNSPTV